MKSLMREHVQRAAAAVALFALIVTSGVAQPVTAIAALDDGNIPGKPLTGDCYGHLDDPVDQYDFFRVYLLAGQRIDITVDGGTLDIDIYLWGPTAATMGDPTVSTSSTPATLESISYTAPTSGWRYLAVYHNSPADISGFYSLDATVSWPVAQAPDIPERIWGNDRYSTAVEIAEKAFPNWTNVDHVILTSGEDRAAADPLAASGLVWTYGGPILLTRSTSVPGSVIAALQQIVAQNGFVEVHVVGGPVSVPDARLAEISSKVSNVTFDRIAPYGNRYELAASIAYRMKLERPTDHAGSPNAPRALIANGEDPGKFFDALALSPIAAKNGWPILLVRKDSIPAATQGALTGIAMDYRIVAGGPNTVSDAVLQQLNAGATIMAVRWWGGDRYETARVIMKNARDDYSPSLLDTANVGVAAKLPDALTGGAFMGLRGGSILITRSGSVPSSTFGFLHNNTSQIGEVYVFGGPNSVDGSTFTDIGAALQP